MSNAVEPRWHGDNYQSSERALHAAIPRRVGVRDSSISEP